VTSDPASQPADLHSIRLHAEARYQTYLDELATLVNIDCGTYLPDGVNQVADLMGSLFRPAGWKLERTSHQGEAGSPRLGDVLVARLAGSSPGGSRILLVGHMDTVFPAGTALERPFRIEGSRALGPGVSDMKGGLLAGFHAVACLQGVGFTDFREIVYVCNPDEEIGSPFSGPIIAERARDVDACFVLEGARENGDIVSARKGVVDLRIAYQGRAAHAGVEPERGRSATLRAAHAIVALHELNGRWPGVTVNVGVVEGGTRPNVVAERCRLEVDVRGTTAASFREGLDEVERVARQIVVPDVTAEVTRMSGFPPMEKTPATSELTERAKAFAVELGFELRDAATGGASDANPVAGMGIPTLDGLGPIGGADHSPSEWLDLQSVVPRVALLAGLIASVAADPIRP
jgi:glutamate carboxypeptidase